MKVGTSKDEVGTKISSFLGLGTLFVKVETFLGGKFFHLLYSLALKITSVKNKIQTTGNK